MDLNSYINRYLCKNNNFEYKVQRVKTDKNSNYIILDVNIPGKRITLVNLYGPNQDNPNFYTIIKQKSIQV